MKKIIVSSILVLGMSSPAWAAASCHNYNTALQIALDGTKGLLELADVPVVQEYRGGVLERTAEKTLVTIEAHYRFAKDWYHIIVRNSDCRILATELRGEYLTLNSEPNTLVLPLQ